MNSGFPPFLDSLLLAAKKAVQFYGKNSLKLLMAKNFNQGSEDEV